jgi:signal transduction histidine kinase
MIDRSAHRINHLVSYLLNSTRVEQLQYVATDVNSLIEETLRLAQDRIEPGGITLRKDLAQDIPGILVDREKIKLAFLNLIVNAIEAMDKTPGELLIRTYIAFDRCHILFSDNGAGMDDETRLKLFEPYFTGKAKRNGLGLTHTQSIIINHKGTINLESQPGEGSRFTIILLFHRSGPANL